MGGFVNVVRRMMMACLAAGLVFGTPNSVLARDPPLHTARLPWQTGPAFASTAPFDNGWARVVSETKRIIRAYADLRRYGALPAMTTETLDDVGDSFWSPNVRTYSPPNSEQPTIYLGTFRATPKPVEVESSVVAESRNMQGVLMGLQIEVVD